MIRLLSFEHFCLVTFICTLCIYLGPFITVLSYLLQFDWYFFGKVVWLVFVGQIMGVLLWACYLVTITRLFAIKCLRLIKEVWNLEISSPDPENISKSHLSSISVFLCHVYVVVASKIVPPLHFFFVSNIIGVQTPYLWKKMSVQKCWPI